MQPIITLHARDLCFARNTQILFKHLSFSLQSGSSLIVEGANGSGKSTLLRLLAGFILPTHGIIKFNGQSLLANKLNYYENLHYLSHQDGHKLSLTVLENLQLVTHLQQAVTKLKITSVLAALDLLDKDNILVKNLSAGQKRRLALAKLFINPRKIWLLDEPMTALDNNIQHYFTCKMQAHVQAGGILVVSTHQPIHLPNVTCQYLHLRTGD